MNKLIPLGYHDQSELYVINDSPKEEKVLGALSDVNRECLTKRANEIALKLMNGGMTPEEQGYFSKLIEKYSGHGMTQIGSYTATAASQTYGSGVVNKAVDFISRQTLGSTMSERLLNMTITATQMAVTPKVLPYLTAFSSAAGGIALPAAVGLVAVLSNRLLASGKYTLETLPPPDQLIRYDSEQKCFFDALGEELGEQELKDLQILIQEYDLICQILVSNKDEVHQVVMNALNFNSEEFKNLDDFEKRALEKEITVLTKRLSENNNYKRGDGILPGIAQLAAHSIPLINRERVEDEQKLHSMLASMDTISTKIGIPSNAEQGLFFDEATNSLYAPSNWISRWWYYQEPTQAAEKVSSIMKNEILLQVNNINVISSNLKSISKEGMNAFSQKIEDIEGSLKVFNKITQSGEGNNLTGVINDLYQVTIVELTKIKEELTSKLN